MTKDKNVSPVDNVISYIQDEIAKKHVRPGDRLPSERKLSEMLGVGRPHIRAALQKLETYGIVETRPQSGTIVTEFTKEQLDGMMAEALKLEKYSFSNLVHVRVLLEIDACELAARNCTIEDIDRVERALRTLEDSVGSDAAVEKDFAFHMELARSSHNAVITDLLATILPDIMRFYHKYRFCTVPERRVDREHREFLAKLRAHDDKGMKQLVLMHLENQISFAKQQKNGEF